MVFERGPVSLRSGLRMCDAFPGAMNVRRSDRPGQVFNRFDATEDQQYLSQLMQSLGKRETHIAWLQQELNKAKGAVQAI